MPPGLVLVAAVLGGLAGVGVALTAPDRFSPDWVLWAFLASTLTAAAAVIGLLGWRSWLCLSGPRLPIGLHRGPVALLAAAGTILACASGALLLGIGLRGPILVGTLIAGAAPCLTVMFAIVRAASRGGRPPSGAVAVELLSELQILLRRMLSSAGALVALATLALGAALRRSEEVLGSSGSDPLSDLLPFAGLGSLAIAVAYIPAKLTLRRTLRIELQRMFPLAANASGTEVLETLGQRKEAKSLVIGDRGIYDELTASLIVASPLITAALQRFLPQA
jgi:hypothetical protein